MKTITITPKNEEIIPFLTDLLSNKNLISDIRINSDDKNIIFALEKINNKYGDVLKKLGE